MDPLSVFIFRGNPISEGFLGSFVLLISPAGTLTHMTMSSETTSVLTAVG